MKNPFLFSPVDPETKIRNSALLLTILLLSFTFNDSKALDTISVRYFPLKIGNKYIYKVFHTSNNDPPVFTGYGKAEISRDTIINSRRYFYCTGFPYSSLDGWNRTDTLTGNLCQYSPNFSCPWLYQEALIDTLGASLNNWSNCTSPPFPCVEISIQNLFGVNTTYKIFEYSYIFHSEATIYTKNYAKNFGLYKYSQFFAFGSNSYSTSYELTGCIVNGVLFGDTSSTGIAVISTIVPKEYALQQNYPNPFNPETKIRYDVSSSGIVSIKVFDVNGREVETLVDEKQSPGTYEVTFDAASITSGVYFYKLQSGEFYETKKMMVIK